MRRPPPHGHVAASRLASAGAAGVRAAEAAAHAGAGDGEAAAGEPSAPPTYDELVEYR